MDSTPPQWYTRLSEPSRYRVKFQSYFSLGNPSKDRQEFVDAIILISALDWSKRLSDFENVVQVLFEFSLRTSNDARFCQTDLLYTPKGYMSVKCTAYIMK